MYDYGVSKQLHIYKNSKKSERTRMQIKTGVCFIYRAQSDPILLILVDRTLADRTLAGLARHHPNFEISLPL